MRRKTGSELPDIHQRGNPDVSGRDLVTLHIYAPPLGVLKTYKRQRYLRAVHTGGA